MAEAEAAVIPRPAAVAAATLLPQAVAVVMVHLPVEAAAIRLPAVAVVVALPHPVAAEVEAAEAIVPAVAAAMVVAAAEDTKLTVFSLPRNTGAVAGTSTQPSTAPAFLLGSLEIQLGGPRLRTP